MSYDMYEKFEEGPAMVNVSAGYATAPLMKQRDSTREVTRVNMSGDVYKRNRLGLITFYRYSHHGDQFTFDYAEDGTLVAINSSSGWSWTKVNSKDFAGWVVHNFFERWRVPADHCGDLYVDEQGIQSTGKNAAILNLPQRP